MRFAIGSLLLAWASLQPAPAAAEYFTDFDWAAVCFTGCGVSISESPDGSVVLAGEGVCPPGREPCLEASATVGFAMWMRFLEGVDYSSSVYFEAMVWHDGGDPELQLFVAKRPDDHEIILRVGEGGQLRLDLVDFIASEYEHVDIDPAELSVPSGVWARVAIRATVTDASTLEYQLWVDEESVVGPPVAYDSVVPRFEEYWVGGDYSADTTLRLDDVCIGHADGLREGPCAERRGEPPTDAGMPPLEDAGVPDSSVPPDSGVAGDSAAPAEGTPQFRGTGGCQCEATGGASPFGAAAALAGLAMLLAFRRRA